MTIPGAPQGTPETEPGLQTRFPTLLQVPAGASFAWVYGRWDNKVDGHESYEKRSDDHRLYRPSHSRHLHLAMLRNRTARQLLCDIQGGESVPILEGSVGHFPSSTRTGGNNPFMVALSLQAMSSITINAAMEISPFQLPISKEFTFGRMGLESGEGRRGIANTGR